MADKLKTVTSVDLFDPDYSAPAYEGSFITECDSDISTLLSAIASTDDENRSLQDIYIKIRDQGDQKYLV